MPAVPSSSRAAGPASTQVAGERPARPAASASGDRHPATVAAGREVGAPPRSRPAAVPSLVLRTLFAVLVGLCLSMLLWQLLPAPAAAADLEVSGITLEPCPSGDPGSQNGLRRPAAATCYALRGEVVNGGRRPVVDTDVFALILDASGEPVLPNRSRVGSIGDVPPGRSAFALRLAVPAGTPGPLQVGKVRARGFSAPVRSRPGLEEEKLPLEQAIQGG